MEIIVIYPKKKSATHFHFQWSKLKNLMEIISFISCSKLSILTRVHTQDSTSSTMFSW
jgi:hypothetical protein